MTTDCAGQGDEEQRRIHFLILNRELVIARTQLENLDNPSYYPSEVHHFEYDLNSIRQLQAAAKTRSNPIDAAAEDAVEDLQQSRTRLELYKENPEMFTQQRRRQLRDRITSINNQIASLLYQAQDDRRPMLQSRAEQLQCTNRSLKIYHQE